MRSLSMTSRFYDEEFSSEILQMLRRRNVLGRSNPAHLAILLYNLYTEAEVIVQKFQHDRRQNPLLETTPAEAWLTAELIPMVQKIRAKVDIADSVLDPALQRYFYRAAHSIVDKSSDEQQLCTSVEAYLPAVKELLIDLYDSKKGLRGILKLPPTAYTFREAFTARKPTSRRADIIVQGIKEGWKDQRIARALDNGALKPRNFPSYMEMLRNSAQNFYSMKSEIKKRYVDEAPSSKPVRSRISGKKSQA
jgi:hypothetical protein